MRPAGLVDEDALAPCPLHGGDLQVGVLVIGRDPRIADFHSLIVSLIHGTAKLLIDQGYIVLYQGLLADGLPVLAILLSECLASQIVAIVASPLFRYSELLACMLSHYLDIRVS